MNPKPAQPNLVLSNEGSGARQGLSRRQILKGGLCAAALFTIDLAMPGCSPAAQDKLTTDGNYAPSGRPQAETSADSRIPIIWVEAGICTGCAGSLLCSENPPVEALLPQLRLEFQETLMDGFGAPTMDRLLEASTTLSGQYLLIVDGSVSLGDKANMTIVGATSAGQDVTAQSLIQRLAANALAVVALGTCASFGGIPSAGANPAGHAPVTSLVPAGKPLVRLPGCPPNPGWIVDALVNILTKGLNGLALDALGRPSSAYGHLVHDVCPRPSAYDAGDYATAPGDPKKCLVAVGCKGPTTYADCPTRLWNGRTSCIGTNHPCIGCASPGFPDARSDAGTEGQNAASPFYVDP